MKRFGIAILLSALCGCTAVNTARLNPAVVPASKPATAGIAAGSHANKTLSTGPAEVGVGRKAFPPDPQPSKRAAGGPMQPNTMGGGGFAYAYAVDYPCNAHDCVDGCGVFGYPALLEDTSGTANVKAGGRRNAFPSPERTTSHHVLGNHARRDDDTAPNDTASHDLQFGPDAKHNDVEPNDAGAAYCEEFGSRNGLVCMGRTAPPVPATPFSGFGVVTKEPLVIAHGPGAARLITLGEYIICRGKLSCAADLDGSYELCLGDHACKDVVHESCVVDVGPPSPLYGQTVTVLDLGFELHILREQNEHCKDGKDRVNLYLDWLFASLKLGNEP